MKTWTNPELEELEIWLTAKKADPNHFEGCKPGEGHGGKEEDPNPFPGEEDDDGEGWDDEGTMAS